MKEIEHKWILKAIPKLDYQEEKKIRQGYFSNGTYEIRIRETFSSKTGKTKWVACHKEGLGLIREEIEENISTKLFELLWPLTIDARIEKTRSVFRDKFGLIWEIDNYFGLKTPLFSCELEIPSTDYDFVIPSEIATLIDSEVTGNIKWLNSTIARNGIPL